MVRRQYSAAAKNRLRNLQDRSRFNLQQRRDETGKCIPEYRTPYTSTLRREAPAWQILKNPSLVNHVFTVQDSSGNNVEMSFPWIKGFTDGEGTLTVHLNRNSETEHGFQIQPIYILVQGFADYQLLTAIANFFGFGSVTVNKADETSVRYQLRISDKQILNDLIVPLFRLSPLLTKKGEEFVVWADIVEDFYAGRHRQDWPRFIARLRDLKYVGSPTDQALDYLGTCDELEANVLGNPYPPQGIL